MAILEDVFKKMPEARENYQKLINGYNFTSGVPKYKLYVKLDPDTSWERREYIANGIRSYFRNDVTVLLDKKQAVGTLKKSLAMFDVFVLVVGLIALVLAFFLLMVATT